MKHDGADGVGVQRQSQDSQCFQTSGVATTRLSTALRAKGQVQIYMFHSLIDSRLCNLSI